MVESATAGLQLNSKGQIGLEGTTQYSLLYVRFHVLAAQMKQSIEELEAREEKDE